MEDLSDNVKNEYSTDFDSKFKSIIESVYKKYKYLEITEQEYENIVFLAISDLKAQNAKSSSHFFRQRLQFHIKEYARNLLQDKEKFPSISSRYVKSNILNGEKNILEILNKIKDFFELADYDVTLDDYAEFLNCNTEINDIIGKFVSDNLTLIKSGKLDELINDEDLISIIESYCFSNNIELCGFNTESNNVDFSDVSDDIVRDYLRNIAKVSLLSASEEKELLTRYKNGDMIAKDILVERNLRLVVFIAKKYLNKGMDFIDLIQEGNLGLVKSIEYFDLARGTRLSTYATTNIKRFIERAIKDKARNIRIPVSTLDRLSDYMKKKNLLVSKLNRIPSEIETAKALNMPLQQVIDFEKIKEDTISLNSLVGEDKNDEFGDFIEDINQNTEEDAIKSLIKKDTIQAMWNVLSPREFYIVSLSFGFLEDVHIDSNEIGIRLGITRERVRVILNRALLKLKHSKYRANLANYLDSSAVTVPINIQFKGKNIFNYKTRKTYGQEIFYEIFPGKNDMNLLKELIDKLSDYEKGLIKAYCSKEETVDLDLKDYEAFYSLIKKLQYELQNKNEEISIHDSTKNSDNKNDRLTDKKIDDILTDTDLEEIKEFMESPKFKEFLEFLPVREALILALKSGCINNRVFSNLERSKILELKETTTNSDDSKISSVVSKESKKKILKKD